jgi:hypothetical protein
MTDDEHAFYLGKLLVNFHSLEFTLRAFLQNQPDARPFGLPDGTDIYLCRVGTELPENEFTSYDTLGQLIKKLSFPRFSGHSVKLFVAFHTPLD